MANRTAKPKTRRWALDPTLGKMVCYSADYASQTLAVFAEAAVLSDFHDEYLARATKELNAIIKNIQKNKKDPNLELAFLKTSKGLYLAWTDNNVVNGRDDEAMVKKALGLKSR